jgi:hypothetical protein
VKHDDEKNRRLERFRTLVEAYGTNPERWPAEERHTFYELASSDEARAWLAEQRRLDQFLDGAEPMAPSPALLRRVAEIPIRHAAPSTSGWAWPFGRLRTIVGAAAAVAAVGMVVGVTTPDNGSNNGADEWDELSTLALGADLAEEP